MPIPILMPALSPTMEEGKLARWLVKEGDSVSAGDVIAEIETDKATMEVEAVDEGTVGQILVPEGTEGVPVNRPIAVLLAEGEDKSALDGRATAAKASGAKPAESAAKAAPAPAQTAAAAAAAPQAQPAPAPLKANGQGGRIFASPLARRVAKERSINLAAVHGSGPHGRIVLRDVEEAIGQGVATVAQPAAAPGQPQLQALVPASGKAIAPQPMPDEQILALLRKGHLRRRPARQYAQDHRRPPDAGQGDHPAFLSDHRLRAGQSARSPPAPQYALAEGRAEILPPLGQRLHHQGHGPGADAGADRQCHLDPAGDAVPQTCRCRGGRRHRGRPVHAGDPQRRGQDAGRNLAADARPRRARPQAAPGAARISGRLDRDLQSRHVWRSRISTR